MERASSAPFANTRYERKKPVRETTLQGFRKALIIGSVFVLVWTTSAHSASAQPALPAGRHFIVLIDDSCSVAGCSNSRDKIPAIIADLPDRLFGATKGVAAFDPDKDRLSVLFFTILNESRACDVRHARSVLPENIFDLAFTGQIQSKEDFANKLQTWMFNPCHFKGHWSPIVISSLLVLPFMQPRLPAGELHSKTILIQVTDGEFNSRTTPGHELTDYRRTGLINDVEAADKLLNEVSKLFSLNILPEQHPVEGVFYLTAEYSSQRVPESAIQYQRNSSLYPQALSSGELRYRLNDQLLGDIQLLSQDKEAGFDFKPLWLRVGFQDDQGRDWRIGEQTLPRLTENTGSVALSPCQAPQCEVSKDRMGVRLFDAALGRPLKLSSSAADPGPGQIKFNIGFHYDTRIYDHLCVETQELLINADTARPAEIPNLFLPASHVNKADIASEWTNDDDGVTTQEEAKNRILARRNVRILLFIIVLVIAVILLMIFLFLRYSGRAFDPQLKWLPRPKVVIDFNQSTGSRMLAGTLQVENDQPVRWLGRLLKNEEQPTRLAEISLNYNYFEKSGLRLADKDPIGFVHGQSANRGGEELDRKTVETVSDGREVYVFFAAETIDDYQPITRDAAVDDAEFDIPVTASMEWQAQHAPSSERRSPVTRGARWLRSYIAADHPGTARGDLQCKLILKPEEPRKPIVTYTPTPEPRLYFNKGSLVQVGSFWFKSQADKDFARPYFWQGYTIKSYQGNRALIGEPIRLESSAVEVPPKANVEVAVYIYCDSETILNPDPATCEYSFKLFGDFSADSEPGPYFTTLYRDPTRAEIELRVSSPKRQLEVYWTPTEETKVRTLPDSVDVDELIDGADTILLDPQSVGFDVSRTLPRELVRFEVGNTGVAGRGVVEVDMAASIRCDQHARNSIQMLDNRPLDSLLGIYNFNTPQPGITVNEGEKSEIRSVRLHTDLICHIVAAKIPADRFAAEVRLAIRVVSDQGEEIKRSLTLIIPINLEQRPGRQWLAIDFGTSAISAALGAGRDESVMMVPLQTISSGDGRSLAQYDIENSERDNKYLLPSWICCNSDLRKTTGDTQRPGFPGYYSENLSMTPGEPDFVGLPAVTHEFEEYPGRIIYSLKSWLGKASRGIPIQIKENGHDVQKILPLDKMVESGFAALAKGYLFDADYRADQIVISHPNTFTRRHQDLLHRIAYAALGRPDRFRIPLPERIKLISESDAVAYHYCIEQMRGHPRVGTERILVYDFGAGTLDLSVITVVWKRDAPRHPISWRVQRRLGVPIAGNYIDEILARLIHRLLSDPDIVDANGFTYRFPIVARPPLDPEYPLDHRRAIIRLWNWIRESKHEWSRTCRGLLDRGESFSDLPPFTVKVGEKAGLHIVVAKEQVFVNAERPTDRPGLWVDELFYIQLSIPASLVLSDPGMTQFRDFVTRDVIDEVLDGAEIDAEDIQTVIVSGRGALFPDLRESVWRYFPGADHPDLHKVDSMKTSVVLGAIARQDLSKQFDETIEEASVAAQLGVLINYGDDLILETDWDKPIDLTASPTFRLVQVNHKHPNPRVDMKSLRRNFYIDLTDRDFVRDDILGEDKHLYIHKEIRDGELAIYLEGKNGENRTPVFTEGQIARIVTTPPWPVGNVLLDPHQ